MAKTNVAAKLGLGIEIGFKPTWRPLAKQLFPIFAGACCCTTALAAPGEFFTATAEYSLSQDDNLFRTQNGQSDTYHTTMVGIALEKMLSRQRLTALLNLGSTHFNRFTTIDYKSKDVQGGWNWHLGNNFEGNLSAYSNETLTPFGEFREQLRNLRARQGQAFEASWRVHPRWRVRAGVSQSSLSYDLLQQRFGNLKSDTTEVALDHFSSSNNIVGLLLRQRKTSYPYADEDPNIIGNQLPVTFNDHEENDIRVRLTWVLSGKTQVEFMGGWTERKHENFPVRDFSGVNGRIIVKGTPTGKIGFECNLWREIGAVDNLVTSYSVNQGISIAPTWLLASKLRLEGGFNYEKRDYVNVAGLGLARNDKKRDASLTLAYFPIQQLQMSVSVFYHGLDSNNTLSTFRDRGAAFNVRYQY